MATLQKDNKKKVRKQMLHMPLDIVKWIELAYWAFITQSEHGGGIEIRFTRTSPSMLQLQYKSRGKRGNFHRKHAKNRRKRVR